MVKVETNYFKIVDLPDVTPKVARSQTSELATYALLSLGGMFAGGEMGFLGGTFMAARRRGGGGFRKRIGLS